MGMRVEVEQLIDNIEKVIIGKRNVIEQVVVSLFSGGHILIEDIPGVGKTQLVSALSRSVSGSFRRIQMTPDVMPSDIVGYTMIHPETKKITYQKGAAFCNFLLADEINRASPKAQSSLLEVMEEHQISLEGRTFPLPKPFMTLATQNPIETYGTYHLPEAQMDRFLMRISIGYPDRVQELQILSEMEGESPVKTLQSVITIEDVVRMQEEVMKIKVSPPVRNYIWQIADATRHDENIRLGVSPRGTLALQRAAKAYAYMQNRGYVTPDDVRSLAEYVLAHRIMLTPKGKGSLGTQGNVINHICSQLPVPHPEF